MSEYSKQVSSLRAKYDRKIDLKRRMDELILQIEEENEEFCSMLEALEYIGAVSDANTNKILDFITGVINNALSKLFPYSRRIIKLERSLYRNAYTHINVILMTGDGKRRNLGSQSGKGLRQIISFLFRVALIEIRKERKILIMDELLSGLHSSAKAIIEDIMNMFVAEGFQFIAVEYGMNDIGKIYLLEKKTEESSTCTEFQGEYTDDIVFMDKDDEAEVQLDYTRGNEEPVPM